MDSELVVRGKEVRRWEGSGGGVTMVKIGRFTQIVLNSRNCQRTTYSSVGGLLLSVDGLGTPLFDLSGLSLSIRLSDRFALRTKSSEAIGFR